jgi:hypothetical protein
VLPARCTWPRKGPKLEHVNIPYDLRVFWSQNRYPLFAEYALRRAVLPKNGRLPLTADKGAGFNPEISGG